MFKRKNFALHYDTIVQVKKQWIWVVLAILVASGVITAFYFGLSKGKESGSAIEKSYAQSTQYPLLAKRIFIENPNDIQVNFEPLRKQIKDYYANNNLSGSIYFEYLPTGTSMRIDGDLQRTAASLIKLPAAMELYKAAEIGKVNLDDNVTLKTEWLDSGYGNLYKKGAGYSLTLREAAKIMLQESDNTALKAVAYSTMNKVPEDQSPFNGLDVDFSRGADLSVAISARAYSSFLKCLYFSCYNTKYDSQEILTSLTQSSFDSRLKAGISDKSVPVAHKIGVFNNITQSDCGIIYVEKRNYVLCVMINGKENSETDKIIADISKKTYDYIKNFD